MIFNSEKILIITTAHIGNAIFCTPAIRLLKKYHPSCQIDVVTLHKRVANVFAANPDIQRVYVRPYKYSLQKLMKNYAVNICLNHATFTDYLKEYNGNLIAIGESDAKKHRSQEVLEFMQELIHCEITEKDKYYCLHSHPKEITQIKSKLGNNIKNKILIGIHLGSSRTQIHGWKFWYKKRTQDKRLWPIEHYIQLSNLLREYYPHACFVLTGDKTEQFLGKAFVRHVPQTINLLGKTTIGELTALMSHLDAFVTHDTGVLHVACATPVLVVASLFASTDPNRSGPYPVQPHHVILKANAMTDILPAEVFRALVNQIDDRHC